MDKTGKSLKIKVANIKLHDTAGGFGKGFLSSSGGDSAAVDDEDIELIKPKDPSKVTGRYAATCHLPPAAENTPPMTRPR